NTATTLPLSVGRDTVQHVRVQVLGRFEVRVGGEAVPAAAWQSRKARDLVRILVSRRGRVVAREELVDLLWPDEEAAGHRLSVVLSIVRTVLGGDVIRADRSGVTLDPAAVTVDVDEFLSDVRH